MVLKKFILLALLTACPVLANTLLVNGVDGALGMGGFWIHTDQQLGLPGDTGGSNEQVYWAGAIDITVDNYVRQVFCVQLFTEIGIGGAYSTTMDFSDTPNLERLGWLLKNEFPTTPLAGAAFQLAFWDIIEDNGNGFDVGKVSKSTDSNNPTPDALLTAATKYETDSEPFTAIYGVVYHNTTFGVPPVPVQNLMGGPVTDEGPSPAPEPATVLMIFSGLALVCLGRLRRHAHTH
jgi:hypothetical protein